MTQDPKTMPINWTTTLFFIFTTTVSLIGGGWYLVENGVTWVAIGTFLFMIVATLMAITAGYHRLFAHRSYESAEWLKVLYLIFGAASFQQSCIKWASEHRRHHNYVDKDKDPYNIKRGFWWAHMGWMIHQDPIPFERHKDLVEDKWVMWQEKCWIVLGVVFGFGLPTAIGAAFGDALGGLLFGGFVRLVAAHHFTFFINSYTHTFGTQPYSDKVSARDSWVAAILTFGEGYHNFHHVFASDYRNGIRAYHWDPGKWFIKAMSWVGQTRNLKRMPDEMIMRFQVETQFDALKNRFKKVQLPESVEECYRDFSRKVDAYAQSKRKWFDLKVEQGKVDSQEKLDAVKRELALMKRDLEATYDEWEAAFRTWQRAPLPVPA